MSAGVRGCRVAFVALVAVAGCAPASRPEPQPAQPADVRVPAPGPSLGADPRGARHPAPAAGQDAASVAFGRVVADEEVAALLVRHGARPYTVYLSPGGVHEVHPDSASLDLIPEARRRGAEAARPGVCHLQARLRQMMEVDRHVRQAPGERDPAGRMRLAEIASAREAPGRLLRGEPVIYGLKVVGDPDALRRLAKDPLVATFQPGREMQGGQLFVPGPRPPDEGRRPNIPPEIEEISTEEVRARLREIAARPFPECEEEARNIRADEPGVRPGDRRPVRPPPRGEPEGAEPARREHEAEGLRFSAEPRLSPGRPGVQDAPELQVEVTVTNPTDQRIEIGIRGCTVLLRLYRDPDLAGDPVLDQGRGIGCAQRPMRLALEPGESTRLRSGINPLSLRSLPDLPGRYHAAAVVRLADRTLELPAGEVELTSGQEGLAYEAQSRLTPGSPDTLRVDATVTNTTGHPIYIEYGACSLRVRAYPTPDRSGRPALDSRYRRDPRTGQAYGCPAYLATATIQPGESHQPGEFRVRIPLDEILADSVPDGRYRLTASLRLNFRETPEFPAGSADLAMEREPLPASRRSGSATYRADTRVVAGDSEIVRSTVTATLTGAGSARLRFSYECPIVLYAYLSRERRDAAPRSGDPDWNSREECGEELQEMRLNGGESRTFELEVPVREILDSLPAGRYYFAVAVHGEWTRTFLSAGDAELRP